MKMIVMKKLIEKLKYYISIVRNNFKSYKSIFVRRSQIKKIRNENIRADNLDCPICESTNTLIWSYNWENKKLKKYFCPNCEHIFSNWLDNDLEKTQEHFDYSERTKHNYKSRVEEKVFEQNINNFKTTNGCFLDFGIGANYFVVENISKKYPQHEIWGCDLNERKKPNYFTTYKDENTLEKFDGISSHAVIEHLGDTITTWKYFNKLLKDKEHCPQMRHAFPSQIHFALNEWSIKVPEHLCLFSKKSLKILCAKTGFRLEKIEIREHHHPIFTFTKIKNII